MVNKLTGYPNVVTHGKASLRRARIPNVRFLTNEVILDIQRKAEGPAYMSRKEFRRYRSMMRCRYRKTN